MTIIDDNTNSESNKETSKATFIWPYTRAMCRSFWILSALFYILNRGQLAYYIR